MPYFTFHPHFIPCDFDYNKKRVEPLLFPDTYQYSIISDNHKLYPQNRTLISLKSSDDKFLSSGQALE